MCLHFLINMWLAVKRKQELMILITLMIIRFLNQSRYQLHCVSFPEQLVTKAVVDIRLLLDHMYFSLYTYSKTMF